MRFLGDLSQRTTTIEKPAHPRRGLAENVSRHDRSSGFVDAALKQWLASPAHKKNIDGDYDLAGIGAAQDANGVVYFTQILVKKR